jgi:hypothetical protein
MSVAKPVKKEAVGDDEAPEKQHTTGKRHDGTTRIHGMQKYHLLSSNQQII